MVSSTVKDLVAGLGLRFEDRGDTRSKGFLIRGVCSPLEADALPHYAFIVSEP